MFNSGTFRRVGAEDFIAILFNSISNPSYYFQSSICASNFMLDSIYLSLRQPSSSYQFEIVDTFMILSPGFHGFHLHYECVQVVVLMLQLV